MPRPASSAEPVNSQLFLSYKREDEACAGRLARALERAGFSVWWDRSLLGAESWRAQIEQALDMAQLVIVCWSHLSVGLAGDFVRDEASRAKTQGKLIPVFIERVSPPLGFGELQAIDLSRWRGAPRDVFFQDLVGLVRARLEGHPPPKPKGPLSRLLRRLRWASVGTAASGAIAGFASNLLHVQDAVCAASITQPVLGDACGALRLGKSPTRAERIAWASRARGSCESLREHLRNFPEGAYRSAIQSSLLARVVTDQESWATETKRLPLFIAPYGDALATVDDARRATLERGSSESERLCGGFATGSQFKLVAARVELDGAQQALDCEHSSNGYACSARGWAICELQARSVSEREVCRDPG